MAWYGIYKSTPAIVSLLFSGISVSFLQSFQLLSDHMYSSLFFLFVFTASTTSSTPIFVRRPAPRRRQYGEWRQVICSQNVDLTWTGPHQDLLHVVSLCVGQLIHWHSSPLGQNGRHFYRRHFETHFHERKYYNFDYNFTEVCSQGFN